MARTVTIASIITRARILADMKSSNFVSDDEALQLLNDLIPELYDELVTSYQDYYATTYNLDIASGNNVYSLPDDFYKLLGVDFKVNNDAYITLKPFMMAERNVTLTTNVTIPTGVIRLRYVPAPPVYTSTSDTFDGIAGWDRLPVLLLAIAMLTAEESDTTALRADYARTLQRIRDASDPRDAGMPYRVVDAYKPNIQLIYGALRYRLIGSNIEFINTELLGAEMFPPFI